MNMTFQFSLLPAPKATYDNDPVLEITPKQSKLITKQDNADLTHDQTHALPIKYSPTIT